MATGDARGVHTAGDDQFDASADHPARQPGAWLEWLMLVGYAAATAIAIGCALGIVVALTASAAMAAPVDDAAEATQNLGRAVGPQLLPAALAGLPRLADIAQADRAGLLLDTAQGLVVAPVQATTARIDVTGSVVRGAVTQRFTNPSDRWLEGVFVFPVPEGGAVDRVRMDVGERTIDGDVAERGAARERYERAKARGLQGSLVEEHRPDLFTARVAHIPPWATIEVGIDYQQTLALRDGAWRLRFPAIATAASAEAAVDAASGAAHPPALSLVVDLDGGMPVSRPVSESHDVLVIADRADRADHADRADRAEQAARAATPAADPVSRYRVTLAPGAAMPERDFELEWQPLPGHAPAAMLPLEKHGNTWYGMLMLTPPSSLAEPPAWRPREITFVADVPGPEAGDSFGQLQHALRFGLERLQRGDAFNLVATGRPGAALFAAPRAFGPDTRRQALAWIAALRPGAGADLAGALGAAFGAPRADGFARHVIVVSDAHGGAGDASLARIRRHAGDRRVSSVGIGSSPNARLLRRFAELGGGVSTSIGRPAAIERRIAGLFAQLARPMVTDVSVAFEGAQPLDPLPPMRDLHAGEPVVVRARFARPPVRATVSGTLGGVRWEGHASAHETAGAGLHVLWARERIDQLVDRIGFGEPDAADQAALRDEVRALGLAHRLVTPYTSLVAVDTDAARAAVSTGATGSPAQPAGWELVPTFGLGHVARAALDAGRQIGAGLAMLAATLLLLALLPLRHRRIAGARPAG